MSDDSANVVRDEGFTAQQRSLLSGDGPWKLEVEIRVEGCVFGGVTHRDTGEVLQALYRAYSDVRGLMTREAALRKEVRALEDEIELCPDVGHHAPAQEEWCLTET